MDQLIKENLKDEEESLLWGNFFTCFLLIFKRFYIIYFREHIFNSQAEFF